MSEMTTESSKLLIPLLHHHISLASENRVLACKIHLWSLCFPCIKSIVHEKSMHVEIRGFLLFSQEIQRWQQHQCQPSFPTVATSLPSLSAQVLCHTKQGSHDHGDKRTLKGDKPRSTPHKE